MFGRGFVLGGNTFTTFDAPGISWPEGTVAQGMNDNGQIVGSYGYGGGQRAFLLSGDIFTTIEVPNADPSSPTYATGINNLGQIVGYYFDAAVWKGKGFLLSGDTFTTIEVPGATNTEAHGINHAGQVVGYYETNGIAGRYGFLLSGNTFTTIEVPGARDTELYAINNFGDIIGLYYTPNGNSHGFLFHAGTFTDIVMPYGWNTTPRGINDSGEIVGNFNWQGTEHGFLATPVVPTTITVNIDIKPGGGPNNINPKSNGKIQVAILSTNGFDAPEMVDTESLTFGRTGEEDSLAFCDHKPKDENKDGLKDLICHFNTQDAGFQCHDTLGILKGKTIQGTYIEGSDSVRINPCK